MKTLTMFIATITMASPVMAGTSAKEVVAPPPSCQASWFTGGSVGYLLELEEPMYHLHLGQDTCYQWGGWDFAWFLEVGFTEKDETYTGESSAPPLTPDSFDIDELEEFLSSSAGPEGAWGYDLNIIPITINGKFEKPLSGALNCYWGAGLGFSQVDLDVDAGGMGISDDDWVFTFQAFAGLNYDFSPSCELYGGARWIYFDDADIDGYTLELEDDVLLEIGCRYNF